MLILAAEYMPELACPPLSQALEALHGYLAHKKQPPLPQDHRRTPGIESYCRFLGGGCFLSAGYPCKIYNYVMFLDDMCTTTPQNHLLSDECALLFYAHQKRRARIECEFITHQEFLKSFRTNQLSHESVDLPFTINDFNNKLRYLCGS